MAISGRPRHDSRGRFVGYEGVGRDISERKAAHERLVASEQRWSLMAGLASDWYWETDTEHRLMPMTPEFRRRYPAMVEQLQGKTRWDAHRDALPAAEWAEHRADLDARRPFRGLQFEADMGDGRLLWLSISGIPRFDPQGRFLGYHGVGRDITVRKTAERLLMRHNEELQRAVTARTRDLEQLNRDLEAFSRQLAHELRTPISHVQGLAHLLESRIGERLSDDERQLLDLQVVAARHMRDTVDALLLLARSTVQPMPMETVDVSALARQALSELPASDRTSAIDWQIEPGLVATASPGALRIVLANLLGNAAKFTRGTPDARVRLAGRNDPDGRLRVVVEDNGAGFDPDQASRLFTPFTRLHAGDTFHGTGIGLSIVQRIVERHGGTVAAHGQPGRGAIFEFTLAPAAGPAPTTSGPQAIAAG
jgi:PAS domain S-box-containing protein